MITGASVTIARPNSLRTPREEAKQSLVLQTTFGKTIPVLEALVEMTLERRALSI